MIQTALAAVNTACRTMSVFKNFASGESISSFSFAHSLKMNDAIANTPKTCQVYTSIVIILSYTAFSDDEDRKYIVIAIMFNIPYKYTIAESTLMNTFFAVTLLPLFCFYFNKEGYILSSRKLSIAPLTYF